MKRLATFALLLALAGVGCQKRSIMPNDLMPPRVQAPEELPTYNALVERYNANLRGLDRLWASTDVELAWRDDDGDQHFEKGDGKFLFVPPRDVALTVEKLGKTFVWAGSNDERFWLFERQEDYAYVGRHAYVGKPCAKPLPLPVHPSTVPYLLGLMPLDPVAGSEPAVEVIQGYHVIEPPGFALQLMLDPVTASPVRIDLLDAKGRSVIVSRLRDHRRVAIPGVAVDQQPVTPGKADLMVMDQEARVTLVLDRLSTDPAKFQARAFDFAALTKAMKPRHIVELDGDCD